MSQVDDQSDGWTSDYLRDLNTHGPASANVPRSGVVSHRVQYRAPDTSDIPLAPGQNPEDSVYSNASGARMGQLKPRSGYNPPAGGGYTARTFPSSGGSGRRYARSKGTQSRASKPANGVTRSAPISGDDVTAAVMKAVKADGNTSFANWRQSLVNQGWDGDPSRIKYDPSTGKFVDTGGGVNGGAVTPEQTEAQASHRAESYPAEVGNTPVGGAQPAPVSGAQPAPVSGTQPAPAKTDGSTQPAPVSGAQSAPADDHEQEVKAAVDEFLKRHPTDGKERLKSIYGAVDSQNIKDDAAYNLAVLAEIQKASTASGDTSDVDNILNNPGNPSEELPSEEFAALQKRGEQTNAGAAEYSDTIRTGLAWAKGALPASTYNDLATLVNAILTSNDPNRYEQAARALSVMQDESARQQKAFQDATEGSKVTGDPAALEPRAAAARQFFINDQKNKLAGRYFADALGARVFHDAMDGNIVTPDSIRAAEYVRQLRAANAARAQAAAEAAVQRSDNPEGWL